MNKKEIKVCFSTEMFKKYADGKSTVIVVDILRATSVISTAFECGIKSIIPLVSLNEILEYKESKNHIIAAERNTLKLNGFTYGNSPYDYLESNIKGKILCLLTTNGTKAIYLAKGHKVITASFINIESVKDYLVRDKNDVIIFCSGWKGLFSLEDAIFAGALSEKLLNTNTFDTKCDSLQAAMQLYINAKSNLFTYLSSSAYRKRNSTKSVLRDTHFCLKPSIKSSIIPTFKDGKLIKG